MDDPNSLMPKNGEKTILYLLNVYKKYEDKIILNDIDLSITKGELCTVVGPSGCGKSTLLRLILGREKQTSGRVLFKNKQVGFPSPGRGIVDQKYSLYPNMTALENVTLGLRLKANYWERFTGRREISDRGMVFLEKVRLTDHWKKYPYELSGGMQQRVAIAQQLIMNQEVLLMDEPFGALDPGSRESMQVFLLQLWEEYKITVFFVTHDLEEAVYLGTRILVLSPYYTGYESNGLLIGSTIVADHALARRAESTVVKEKAEFGSLVQQIRREGFDPKYMQHISRFNLDHPDSFRT